MLTHAQIWAAIDRLAARAGLSASGLAKRAGLDPTTFNKSKRITREGRERWPSTESVAKSLAATGISIDEFVALIADRAGAGSRGLPALAFSKAAAEGHFDGAGLPMGKEWAETAFPALSDAHAYALEVAGDGLAPTYRDGTVIVVSPAAPVRRGDRVIAKTRAGEVMVAEMRRPPGKTIELRLLTGDHAERNLPADDMAWVARIVWASQ
jgi:phage repressor protein C with HTH and peptisase S24 domain